VIFLESVSLFLATLLIAGVCGYGALTLLLPKQYEDHRFLIVLPIGYTVFSSAAFIFSGTVDMAGAKASVTTFAFFAVLSVVVFLGRDRSAELTAMAQGLRKVTLLTAPMLLVMFWPLFLVGPETFLAAVNPDTMAGFFDILFLEQHPTTELKPVHYDSYSYLNSVIGSTPHSARFASILFIVLLDFILPVEARTAIPLAISLFMTCVPLATYFATRIAFGMSDRAATWAAWFTGISGCVTMSWVYFYIGQNSGLGVLPVVMTVGYILVTNPSWRIFLLAGILANSLFSMYMGMLPYALTPVGGVALYQLLRGDFKIFLRSVVQFGGVVGLMILLNAGMGKYLAGVLFGWSNLVGQTLQGQYFLDFLTEHFVPIFLGLANYPMPTSYLGKWLGGPLRPSEFVLIPAILALVVSMGVVASVVDWARRTNDKRHVAMALAGIVVFAAVWYVYTFGRQYAYAVFKMSSWLQFMLAPFIAYMLERLYLWTKDSGGVRRIVIGGGFAGVLVVIVGGNLLTSTRYAVFSLGKDTDYGYIINVFDVSGNYDYRELAKEIPRLVDKDKTVGISVWSVVSQSWIGYYIWSRKTSFLGHHLFPGDDENLPDIRSRRVVDYYGNITRDNQLYFNGATDDYYLTWTDQSYNQDIVQRTLPAAIWRNRSFQLLRAYQSPDFIYTGRGWYRLEFKRSNWNFWWPRTYRWTAEGGEVYMLRPSRPSEPYRLSFLAVTGYGIPSNERTLELYANGEKFDEVKVTTSGRILSKPFIPTDAVTRLVIKVKEHTKPIARSLPLWNIHIPAEYRLLNLLVSQIRVHPAGQPLSRGEPRKDYALEDLFEDSIAFDNINLDGWAGPEFNVTIARPDGANEVLLVVKVPEYAGYKFPLSLSLTADGHTTAFDLDKPGLHTLSMPLVTPSSGLVMLHGRSDQTFNPNAGKRKYRGREAYQRPLRYSVLLQSLKIRGANAPRPGS
jgi:hypothetical protein